MQKRQFAIDIQVVIQTSLNISKTIDNLSIFSIFQEDFGLDLKGYDENDQRKKISNGIEYLFLCFSKRMQGLNHVRFNQLYTPSSFDLLLVGVLEIELQLADQINALEQFLCFVVLFRPLLLRGRVLEIVLHLTMKALTYLNTMRSQSSQLFFCSSRRLQPKMIFSLSDRHPLVLLFEQTRNKIFDKPMIPLPNIFFESNFSFQYIGDGIRVILRLERCISRDNFVNGDPQSPKIDLLIVPPSQIHLRSQVKVSADDGQHIPPDSSRKGLLGDAKIDKFYFPFLLVIKNILWFNIPMTDASVVKVHQCRQKLSDNRLKFFLRFDLRFCQIFEREALHDEIDHPLAIVEIESLVMTNRRVIQLFHNYEAFLQFRDVLLFSTKLFYCIEFFIEFVLTSVHASIASLPYLLEKFVLLKKGVVVKEVILFRELSGKGVYVLLRALGLSVCACLFEGKLMLQKITFLGQQRNLFQTLSERCHFDLSETRLIRILTLSSPHFKTNYITFIFSDAYILKNHDLCKLQHM